jgi:hypothetical protein
MAVAGASVGFMLQIEIPLRWQVDNSLHHGMALRGFGGAHISYFSLTSFFLY